MRDHHKRGIKHTVFSFVYLTIVGFGLFFVANPGINTVASDIDKKTEEKVYKIYEFPDTNQKDLLPSEEPKDYQSKPINKYLVQPQGLPVYVVKSVVDGNTIVVVEEDKRIRLIGIKSPDNDEEYGIEATDYLKDLIENKEIFFQIDEKNPKDSFGRLRGIIYFERKNLNIELLRAGYAHIFPTTPSIVGDSDWVRFEEEAKSFKRGLWSGDKSEDDENTLEIPVF